MLKPDTILCVTTRFNSPASMENINNKTTLILTKIPPECQKLTPSMLKVLVTKRIIKSSNGTNYFNLDYNFTNHTICIKFPFQIKMETLLTNSPKLLKFAPVILEEDCTLEEFMEIENVFNML